MEKSNVDEEEKLLNESYDSWLLQIEKNNCSTQIIRLNELDDGNDGFLNLAYEQVKSKVEERKIIPQNMVYLVQNTKKEIHRNRIIAKIRLRERKIKGIEQFKSDMSDYFYPVESWPSYAIEILLTKNFGYNERIGLACFLHGNGLHDENKALRIFQIYNKSWTLEKMWNFRFKKFQALFAYLKQTNENTETGSRLRSSYYYYDMNLNLTMFYDGNVRTKNGEKKKYVPLFRRYK